MRSILNTHTYTEAITRLNVIRSRAPGYYTHEEINDALELSGKDLWAGIAKGKETVSMDELVAMEDKHQEARESLYSPFRIDTP